MIFTICWFRAGGGGGILLCLMILMEAINLSSEARMRGPGQRPFELQRVCFVLLFYHHFFFLVSILRNFKHYLLVCEKRNIALKLIFESIYNFRYMRERAPHKNVYFQVSESDISIWTTTSPAISFLYCFIINSFTIAERCSVHNRIRDVHFSNKHELTPHKHDKYIVFMMQQGIFFLNYQSNNYYMPQKSWFYNKFTYKYV